MTTRERLIAATERIIRERGIQAVTTKDIAAAAGVAEATLYRHFQDKTELLLCVMSEGMVGGFLHIIQEMPQWAGQDTVEANLTRLTTAAAEFFIQTAPLNAALAVDPAFAARHFARLRELGSGPEVAHTAVAAYMKAEQERQRIGAKAKPNAVATLLLSACFNYAHNIYLAGRHPVYATTEQFVDEVIQTLMSGLAPSVKRGQ